MAEKNDKGLIGFDPLAWMEGNESNEAEDSTSEEHGTTPDIDVEAGSEHAAEQQQQMETVADEIAEISDPSSRSLDAIVNIQNVSNLYEQFLNMLEDAEKIDIDASEVTSIDTASLQLLLILKLETIKLGKEMSIDFPSEKFIEAAELLGIAELLNLDQAASGFF